MGKLSVESSAPGASGTSLPAQTGNGGKFLQTDGTGTSWATAGTSLTVQDEGGALTTAADTLNFVGAGVTATGTGATKTVTIPGGSTVASGITVTPTGTIAATDVQAALAEVASEAAQKSANLSDLASAATARTNLGLGSVALLNAIAVYTWTATKVTAYTATSGQAVPCDPTQRIVTDGVRTSGSAAITSATALFTSLDVGRAITGTGIPTGTTILSVTSGTAATMSANATASASGASFTIGGSFPVTLPTTATDATARIRNVSGNTNMTVVPPASSTLDGSTTGVTLAPGDSIDVSAISSTAWVRV